MSRKRICRRCRSSISVAGATAGASIAGIDLALRRLLASPKFLVRVERDPATVPAGTAYRLSDLEIASRLSFFLWSSIPDDTLLDVASKGGLKTAGWARAAGAADACRSEVSGVHRQLRRPVAAAAESEDQAAQLARVPRLRRQPAHSRSGPRRNCSSRRSCARIAACST